jgi:multimeric flavodoxin WrbA
LIVGLLCARIENGCSKEERHMKVIAFNASAQKDGNTAALINLVLGELQREEIGTELFQLAGKEIRGCLACFKCFQNRDQRCSVKDDVLNECIEKMLEADGIILGSPTYFANVSTEMKALIDRAGFVAKANDDMFKRKVGVAVVADLRAQVKRPIMSRGRPSTAGGSSSLAPAGKARKGGCHADRERAGPQRAHQYFRW